CLTNWCCQRVWVEAKSSRRDTAALTDCGVFADQHDSDARSTGGTQRRFPPSRSSISAIFASTALFPSALSARGARRASVFSSWARSFIAARSSAVNPLDFLPLAVVLLGGLLLGLLCAHRSLLFRP